MYIAENLDHLKELLFIRKVLAQDIDVSNVITMPALFEKKTEDDFRGYISDWNVSNIIDMSWMFNNSKFNGDISRWNVSNVTDMFEMFSHSKFNGDISEWNVSNVTSMTGIFKSSKFSGNISRWNVSNVTYMFQMFRYSEFNGDISKWDVRFLKTSLEKVFEDSKLEIPSTWKIQKLLKG